MLATLLIVLYCLSGSGLTVLNKVVVSNSKIPNTLTCLQCLATAILLLCGSWLKKSVFGDLSFRLEVVKDWLFLVLLFVLMLVSSMYALIHVSITTLIVLRNLTTLTTAAFDCFILKTSFDKVQICSLIALVIGAIIYGLHDLSYSAVGYGWLGLNCMSTTGYQVYVKVLIKKHPLSNWEMSFYNNVLCLPLLACFAVLKDELGELRSSIDDGSFTPLVKWSIVLSCAFGFMLSTSAFALNKLITATSMMVVNNVNKFGLIFFSEFLLQSSLSVTSSVGCVMALISAVIYSQANRVSDYFGNVKKSPSTLLKFCLVV